MFSPEDNVIDFSAFAAIPNLPPQNIEAEEAILGGILIDPEAISRVSEFLLKEAFYINAHAAIYQAALSLYASSQPTDLLSVTAYLADHKMLDKVGGRTKLAQLVDGTVSAVNIDAHAALVMDKYTRRCLLSSANMIEKLAHDGTKPVSAVVDQAEQIVYNIACSSKKVDYLQVETVAQICPRVWQQMEQGKTLGLQTGFLDLDAKTGGFYPGTLTIAAARTAIGKTQLAIALTYQIAAVGLPVVFFTCEMSKEEITNRLLARISLLDSNHLRTATIMESEWAHLAASLKTLSDLPIHIHSSASSSSIQMRGVLRRVASQYGGKLGLVVLDYIQLLGEGTDNRVQELDKIVRDFRTLAKEFNVPCFGLAQINRGVETRSNKRPLLSDIRESGAIEAHADVVMLLYRDEYYNPSSPDRGTIEIDVAKNRHGQTGTVKMQFFPQYSLFRNLAGGIGR